MPGSYLFTSTITIASAIPMATAQTKQFDEQVMAISNHA